MRFLILGHGKTGKLLADVAAEHGHSVHVLDAKENTDASALTAPFVAGFDAVVDFTTPEAVIANMRACLATGAKMVVGTTGWYDKLGDMRGLAERRGASLLYGTNFSIGVQVMLQMAQNMASTMKNAGYEFKIVERHHVTKADSPSGTALSMATMVEEAAGIPSESGIPIEAIREGEIMGEHMIEARGDSDVLTLKHEAFSRRVFAEGAIRAAEWLIQQKPGSYDFRDVWMKM